MILAFRLQSKKLEIDVNKVTPCCGTAVPRTFVVGFDVTIIEWDEIQAPFTSSQFGHSIPGPTPANTTSNSSNPVNQHWQRFVPDEARLSDMEDASVAVGAAGI
jgi:hypothetical protein